MKLISKKSGMIDEVSFVFYDEPNAREGNSNQRNTELKRKECYKNTLKSFIT